MFQGDGLEPGLGSKGGGLELGLGARYKEDGLEPALGSKGLESGPGSRGWAPRSGIWAGFAGFKGDELGPGLGSKGTWAGFQGLGSQGLEPLLGSEGDWRNWLEAGLGSKAMGWNLGWVRRRWAGTWAGF